MNLGIKSEDDLQVWTCAFLKTARPDLLAFHYFGEGKRTPRQMAYMKKRGFRHGISDWEIISRTGRTYWIELKFGKNKQTQDQIDFMNDVRSRGHIYEVAYTDDEFIKIVQSIQ